jgi:uncharacterized protein YdaU (DUF1376 family)
MHYYSFHISDYRKYTGHLSPIEHYIYRTLIDWYFLDESPIPKETQLVLRRLCLGIEAVKNLENVLNDFFILGDLGWIHNRIERDIRLYHSKAERNRVNGKLGGRPPKTQVVSDRIPNANPTESDNNPNHKPITNNHKPIKEKEMSVSQTDLVPEDKKTERAKGGNKTLILEIFEYWKEIMSHKTSRLDAKREKAITDAIKYGYSVEQLKAAILGCSLTPFNCGENDRNTRYDGICVIFKSADQIDRFIGNSIHPPVNKTSNIKDSEKKYKVLN